MPFEPRLYSAGEAGSAESTPQGDVPQPAVDDSFLRTAGLADGAYDDAPSDVVELEFALVPTLAALGDRLGAEADLIAARYPIDVSQALGAEFWAQAGEAMAGASARESDGMLPIEPRPAQDARDTPVVDRSRWWFAVASSGAVAAVVLITLVVWRLGRREAGTSDGELTAAIHTTDPGPRGGAAVNGDSHAAGDGTEPKNVTQGSILRGLSGAEQEAVLDLLERESTAQSNISI